jgi:hypothetical protein
LGSAVGEVDDDSSANLCLLYHAYDVLGVEEELRVDGDIAFNS